MAQIINKRLLLQGPWSFDLTDLLCYDGIVILHNIPQEDRLDNKPLVKAKFAETQRHFRIVDEATAEKLFDAGLLLKTNDVFSKNAIAEIAQRHPSPKVPERITIEKLEKQYYETVFIGFLHQLWTCFDSRMHDLAIVAQKEKINAVPKFSEFYPKSLSNQLKTGRDEILSIIYNALPVLDTSRLPVDDVIAFLQDKETRTKRRRLFAWQNGIEGKIEKGDLKLEHLQDLIATMLDDYVAWQQKCFHELKCIKREFWLYTSFSILGVFDPSSVIIATATPMAVKKCFELKVKKMHLTDDEKAPGRELAFIVHAEKSFSN